MCLRCLSAAARCRARLLAALVSSAAAVALLCAPAAAAEPERVLRVCADPNNLPFSNERGEGFENELAELVAGELGARVEYTWWAQRRGFVRNTLGADDCDAIMGVPAGFDPVLTTAPYYRSTYAFVYRAGEGAPFSSLDDPRLRELKVGVHLIGDDFANTPPAHALGRRGIVANVVGYSIYGDYAEPNPPARLVDAVARGDVDVAIVWGPLAGYFASREPKPLAVTPIDAAADGPIRFSFAIALGVRRGDEALRDELDAVLVRERGRIDALLAKYGVPRVAPAGAGEARE